MHVNPRAHPIIRPVPFAIKAKIDAELDELEKNGVITSVAHNDWAAPIVPVPKKNGRFHICEDYKVTINQAEKRLTKLEAQLKMKEMQMEMMAILNSQT